ncbi:hypothetical protein SSS_00135 [Sarcoptes scabiei]|uniref:Uncharacterized protein n=1 Tax=Sarcoptes scabiei TaxID=52283 RepID=A0A834RGS5_SARSC|nr:hypothetical protein SSS_00135 [Sarcoptes scabiei]
MLAKKNLRNPFENCYNCEIASYHNENDIKPFRVSNVIIESSREVKQLSPPLCEHIHQNLISYPQRYPNVADSSKLLKNLNNSSEFCEAIGGEKTAAINQNGSLTLRCSSVFDLKSKQNLDLDPKDSNLIHLKNGTRIIQKLDDDKYRCFQTNTVTTCTIGLVGHRRDFTTKADFF